MFEFLGWVPAPVFLIAMLVFAGISIVRDGLLWLAMLLVAAFMLSPNVTVVLAATGLWFFFGLAAMLVTFVFLAISLVSIFDLDRELPSGRSGKALFQVVTYAIGIATFFGVILYTVGFFQWLDGYGVSFLAKVLIFAGIMIAVIIIGIFGSAERNTAYLAAKRAIRRKRYMVAWLKGLREGTEISPSPYTSTVKNVTLTAAEQAELDALPKTDEELMCCEISALLNRWQAWVEEHGKFYKTPATSIQKHVDLTFLYIAWVFDWPLRLINYLIGDMIRDAFNKFLDAPLRGRARRVVDEKFKGVQ